MMRLSCLLPACAAFLVCLGAAQAQAPAPSPEREAARAAACVPPPCESISEFPPCDDPVVQHALKGMEITAISVADGPDVRPLGGAITGPPELAVCARRGDDSFQFYLPSNDEPVLRLGMLALLNAAMASRAPVDIAYGMPNGALRKIEAVTFGAGLPADALIACGYGDFDRCDTGYRRKPGAEPARAGGNIRQIHLIGYGKGSRAAQIVTGDNAGAAFLIDPEAPPARFLYLMNFAITAMLASLPVDTVSVAGLPPAEAKDQTAAPAIALDIMPAREN